MTHDDSTRCPVDVPQLGAACWTLPQGGPPLFIDCGPDRFNSVQDLLAWSAEHRATLDELTLAHGAIVLKDSPLRTPDDFDALMAQYPAFEHGYVGGSAPRAKVFGRAMESTRMAPQFRINLHQEMAYLSHYPSRVAFFAKQPAEQGGETIIGDMREFTRRLPDGIAAKLEQHGVRGVRNYAPPGARQGVAEHSDAGSWEEAFGTTDRAEVAATCASMGMEPYWNADGSLSVASYTKAFAVHPTTGERFYRTIIHSNYLIYEKYTGETKALVDRLRAIQTLPTGYTLGNGEPLSRDESRVLEKTFEDITVAWPWAAGDVMVLDNLRTAHGRNPFKGERETLVALIG